MRKSLRFLLLVLALFAVLAGSFIFWGKTPARPMPEALNALQSDPHVTVTTGK